MTKPLIQDSLQERFAMNIIHQLGDFYTLSTKLRQDTNDEAIDFVKKILSSLLEASHKELIEKLENQKVHIQWYPEGIEPAGIDPVENAGRNDGLSTAIRIIKDLSKLK